MRGTLWLLLGGHRLHLPWRLVGVFGFFYENLAWLAGLAILALAQRALAAQRMFNSLLGENVTVWWLVLIRRLLSPALRKINVKDIRDRN